MLSKCNSAIYTKKRNSLSTIWLFLLCIIILISLFACNKAPANELQSREISKLEAEIKQNPDDLTKRVELALLYSDVGMHDKAVADINKVLMQEDSYQTALLAKGYILINMGKYKDALEPLNKVVELNKDNPMRYVNRQLETVYYYCGIAYYNLEDYINAAESLNEALAIDKFDADAWYLLGKVYQSSLDFQKAIESFNQALTFVPDFKEAYQGLASCYQETGQKQLVLYSTAMSDYCSGKTDEAVEKLEQVIAENQNYAEVYLGLGLALEKQGEIDKAIEAYKRAANLNPNLWLAQEKVNSLEAR